MTTIVTTPVLYALGTVTTVFSFLVIGGTLGAIVYVGRKQART
jgi:putative spermidine/putrescine transport system permease protein